jgi:predicted RNase H-like HicB family nuclease
VREERAVNDPVKVVMHYHHEPEGWWANSDDLPGFTAAGATFDEVRDLAHSGAGFYLERPVEVEDRPPQVHGEASGSS